MLSYRRPQDVPQRRPGNALMTSLYGSMSKAKKRAKDKDFCIWPQHQ